MTLDVYGEVALDGTILEISPSIERRGGYSREELLGTSILGYHLNPGNRAEVIKELLEKGKVNEWEFMLRHKNGRVLTFSFNVELVKDEDGVPIKTAGVMRDITERKLMEEELLNHRKGLENLVRERTSELREANAQLEKEMAERREMEKKLRLSEEKYRTIFELAADSILLIDAETVAITEFNDKAHENLGYTREEFRKLEMPNIEALESNEDIERHTSLVRKDGKDVFETKHKTKSGEIQDILVNCKLVSVGGRKFFHSIWRDITERKRMETALRQSEKKYRSLVDLTSDSVYEVDKDLKYNYVSPRMQDISGYEPEYYLGRTPFDFMAPGEAQRLSDIIQEGLKSLQPFEALENSTVRKNGQIGTIETSAVPIYDSKGEYAGYLCVDRDITERKRAEELLRQSEEKYRTLFEESKDIVYITTPDGRILDMNLAGVDLLGYSSKEELLEVDVSRDTYWDPGDREAFQKVIAEDGFVRDYELHLKRKDGKRITVLLSSNAVYDDEGTVLEYRGIMHDVTKRRQLEYQLHQSSKLASVGELATGVAHEINNPMAAIDVHAGLIRDVFEDVRDGIDDSCREQIHNSIGTIEQQVERCRSITNNLLSFTRIPLSEGMSFGINELLMKTEKMVSSMSLSDTDVELNFDYGLPSYWGSPNLLQQVFVNLLTNAFKATGTQGKITISTSLEADESIRIQFTDSGHGIPKDIRERIFDPFFTTSPEGEGTGLGLSISYYIVKQLNGEISVDSTPGHGTTFVITLPIADKTTDTFIAD